jgi:aspartate/methionine/tyrosine aminotransferase
MIHKPAERIRNVKKSATRKLFDGAPPGSINLGLGEPDFPTPEFVRRAAISFIEEGRISYTTNAGLPELRERIAAYHNDGARQRFTPDSVCITNGAEEALFVVIMALAGPGDDVLLPNPAYIAYPAIAEIAGTNIIYYNMPSSRGFAFDRESFRQAVTERTRLVVLVSPSNPTSRVIAREDLQFLAKCLEGSDVFVVADEIYRELYVDERPSSITEFYDRAFIISGLSKMMSMTGWRLGWAVGPEEVIRHVTLMHQYASTCASAVSQMAGIAAFSEQGRTATAEMREELRRRRDVMARAIDRDLKLPYVCGEGAFYIMLDVSQFGASEDVAMRLLEERVITVPGSAFGSEGEGYLRLSYSIAAPRIEEGILRIAKGLAR